VGEGVGDEAVALAHVRMSNTKELAKLFRIIAIFWCNSNAIFNSTNQKKRGKMTPTDDVSRHFMWLVCIFDCNQQIFPENDTKLKNEEGSEKSEKEDGQQYQFG
jgi:hypothetical protein